MKPTPSQVRWLKKYLPKGAKPHDLVPRAYCIAKPAPGCAVFVTPPQDVLNTPEIAGHYHQAEVLNLAHVDDIHVGDWVTLAFCEFKHRGCWWEWTRPISFESFRIKK